ncbi:MAG: M6 family metalloprotease domain-containing protein [Paludibacteraceae bacterium]|nr:M6 family metalloprotease domain-containing protein [Paludibacteraceae bacterium]
MRKYGGKICAAAIAVLVSISTQAVPASPDFMTITQPDGSVLKIRLVGDEYHSYYTLEDGTPVRRNKQGKWIEDLSVTQIPESMRKARRAAQERYVASTYPLTGAPKSLVILVNFSDLSFQYKLEDFQKMLNESGYSTNGGHGSARDYFIASSDSALSPIFDCYGPVTLSKGYAYYGANSSRSNSIHADEMVLEACQLVAESGVDIAQYDTNNDGTIDNVFIYYAGHNEAERASENTIWPHRSYITSGEKVAGKTIYDYACTSELRGAAGNAMCGIGTFCHEFGHVLGLPDYYDTEDNNAYTVGTWDIMCSGSYNGDGKTPPSYTSGERFQLGWLKPVQLKEAGSYTLEPLETSNEAYLIATSSHNLSWEDANPKEYWLLENRQALGWDAPSTALPGTGMVIWHINYNASNWGGNCPNNNKPLGYDIEEAKGPRGFSGPTDPFPGTGNVTHFTPMLYDGSLVEQPLINIMQDGQNITFIFKSKGEDNFIFVPAELPTIQSTYNSDTKRSQTPASILKVVGNHLDPNEKITVSLSGNGFMFSTDSTNWRTTDNVDVAADSTLNMTLYVRYAPRKQICDVQRGTLTLRQNSAVGTYIIRGTSPRPTLISAPEVSGVHDVTPTSFKINWTPQDDAEHYYVTLYHMEDGVESTMESFEGFDDEAVVHEAGWISNFYRTTSSTKKEGSVSMWFVQDGEKMTSPLYQLPVTEVSLWLSAAVSTDTEVGSIILNGLTESDSIVSVDTIRIQKSTKKYTYSKSIDQSLDVKRFEIKYTSYGGNGVCVDAFTTTFNGKIAYTYKGREHSIEAVEGEYAEDYAVFYGYDLLPNTDYYVQLQCSENKGCNEHLSNLSEPQLIHTKEGEGVGSKHLTLAYDSISYDPGKHVVYIPQSLGAGSIKIYSTDGMLVTSIPVGATYNIVPLPEDELHRGAIYLIKYVTNDKLARKSPWIKILYK